MKHTQILELADIDKCFRRQSWPAEKKVRAANVGDLDYIGVTKIDGVYVEDCPKPMDCQIRIWNATPEDTEAEDWEIADCKK
jgi:hypothetical protein